MIPCSPAMMFCSIVGHASFHTAGPMGPSTIDRSNFLCLVPTCATNSAVYYAARSRFVSPLPDRDCALLCHKRSLLMLPSIQIGLQTLRANPVRTLLSTLG